MVLDWLHLSWLAFNGHIEIIKPLFDYSDSKTTNLNAKDIHGRTLIIKADKKLGKKETFFGEFSNAVLMWN